MTQPNFTVGNQQAVKTTEFDNLDPDELVRLINEAKKLKTGKAGSMYVPPPKPSVGTFIDYDAKFGGK